ncbi:hypothetical protein CHS0354_016191 [Potamilus streckersoni]|uniref:Uncharacterized protein n=1 Tax=Potamilus streckersoni TaxID=2493646 RepID=A0AAE0RX89_9BIVA|nr:hypothetical protein CHS0354_016191 [Potamilus streckersoni]
MVSYGIIRAFTEIYVVLCLFRPFEQASSLKCYFCAGTNSKSPCLDAGYFLDGIKDTDGKPQMLKNCTTPFDSTCIIEEYRAGGNIASHIRDCSDGSTFAYPSGENGTVYKKLLAEASLARNQTACIFNSIVQVCLTTCKTDYCNGPIPIAAGTYTPPSILILFIGLFISQKMVCML